MPTVLVYNRERDGYVNLNHRIRNRQTFFAAPASHLLFRSNTKKIIINTCGRKRLSLAAAKIFCRSQSVTCRLRGLGTFEKARSWIVDRGSWKKEQQPQVSYWTRYEILFSFRQALECCLGNFFATRE